MSLEGFGDRFNLEQPELFVDSLIEPILEGIVEPLQLRGVLKLGEGFSALGAELLEFANTFLSIFPPEVNKPIHNFIAGYIAFRLYEELTRMGGYHSLALKYLDLSLDYLLRAINNFDELIARVIEMAFSNLPTEGYELWSVEQITSLELLITLPRTFRNLMSQLEKAYIAKFGSDHKSIKHFAKLLEEEIIKHRANYSDFLLTGLGMELMYKSILALKLQEKN